MDTLSASKSTGSILARLFVAFFLGALAAFLCFPGLLPQPLSRWWLEVVESRVPLLVPALASALLAVVMALSVLRDPVVREHWKSPGRTRAIIRTVIVLLLAIFIAAATGGLLQRVWWLVGIMPYAWVPFCVGIAAAFIVAGSGTWKVAGGAGLVAWLGGGLFLLISVTINLFLSGTSRMNPLTLFNAWVVASLGNAMLGGLLGKFLRDWTRGKGTASAVSPVGRAAEPAWSLPLRLLIALVLGAAEGVMAFFPSFESLWNNTLGFDPPTRHPVLWWQTVVPVAVFVVAIFLSLLLDPVIRQRMIPPVRIVMSLGLVLLVAGLITAAGIGLPLLEVDLWKRQLGYYELSLIVAILSPFAVGMGAAFAVGSHRTWRLALGIGLTAWLGSCLLVLAAGHILTSDIIATFLYMTPGITGFGLAALGGLLGRQLRRWFLGSPRVSSASRSLGAIEGY